MPRRTTRSTHPGAVMRSSRGAHGYSGGVSADSLNDPTVVFPKRPVEAPQTSTSPLTAGPDTVGGGGGGVTVDNGSDPPAEVTTLVAPGADVSTPGSATFPLVIVSADDPGAVGARHVFWVRLDVGGADSGFQQLYVRNDNDDGWLPVSPPTSQTSFDGAVTISSPDIFAALSLANEGGISYFGAGPVGASNSGLKSANKSDLSVPLLLTGTADPSAGGGLAATLGSMFQRQNGSAGELWIKTGTADTTWTKLTP